jgi:hypothetical protein
MMVMTAAVAGLLLQAGAGAVKDGQPAGAWILTCDMPRREAPADKRVFRLGPKLFQERNASTGSYGYNLCDAFPCVARADRMEGTIRSTTLSLTISLDPTARQASWRAEGASGLSRSSGACLVSADTVAKSR